jgi:hypothetical protein
MRKLSNCDCSMFIKPVQMLLSSMRLKVAACKYMHMKAVYATDARGDHTRICYTDTDDQQQPAALACIRHRHDSETLLAGPTLCHLRSIPASCKHHAVLPYEMLIGREVLLRLRTGARWCLKQPILVQSDCDHWLSDHSIQSHSCTVSCSGCSGIIT